MNMHQSEKTDFSNGYLEARQEVDELCRNIVLGAVTPDKAMESYHRIERIYTEKEPSDLEFFKMIYRSRVIRLIDQFLQEDGK
jgi:hypothetical protein